MNKENINWREHKGVNYFCLDKKTVEFLFTGHSPGSWFDNNVTMLKTGGNKVSGLIPGPDNQVFYIKRFQVNTFLQRISCLYWGDQACKMFATSRKLIRAGISVSRPLAVIRDLKGEPGAVYFIAEALTDTTTMKKVIQKSIEDHETVRGLLFHAAAKIAEMHRAGFFHGDMKWKNIMLGPGPEFNLFFIDLDTVARLKSSRDRRYALDLARFSVDIAENENIKEYVSDFVQEYAGCAGLTPESVAADMKPYYNKISAKHKIKYGNDVPPLSLRV